MRSVFNCQAIAEDVLLPQQMVQKVKMLCRGFLPGEENKVPKDLARIHEGKRTAPK